MRGRSMDINIPEREKVDHDGFKKKFILEIIFRSKLSG